MTIAQLSLLDNAKTSKFDQQWEETDFREPTTAETTFDWRDGALFDGPTSDDVVRQNNGPDPATRRPFDESEFALPTVFDAAAPPDDVSGDEFDLPSFDHDARQLEDRPRPSRLDEETYADQIARDLAADLEWIGAGSLRALRNALDTSGNKHATASRLRELAEDYAATAEEIELAHELREAWEDYVPAEKLTVMPWHEAIYYTEPSTPTWSLCMELIRSFDALPSVDEILLVVVDLYEEWQEECAEAERRGSHAVYTPSEYFTTYCRRRFQQVPDCAGISVIGQLTPTICFPEEKP